MESRISTFRPAACSFSTASVYVRFSTPGTVSVRPCLVNNAALKYAAYSPNKAMTLIIRILAITGWRLAKPLPQLYEWSSSLRLNFNSYFLTAQI